MKKEDKYQGRKWLPKTGWASINAARAPARRRLLFFQKLPTRQLRPCYFIKNVYANLLSLILISGVQTKFKCALLLFLNDVIQSCKNSLCPRIILFTSYVSTNYFRSTTETSQSMMQSVAKIICFTKRSYGSLKNAKSRKHQS